MTNVTISLEVELMEERAMSASLRNRNLLLAQAVSDLRTLVAEKEAEIADLRAATEKLEVISEERKAEDATSDNV